MNNMSSATLLGGILNDLTLNTHLNNSYRRRLNSEGKKTVKKD